MAIFNADRLFHIQVGLAKAGDMYHIGFNYGADAVIGVGHCEALNAQWGMVVAPLLLDCLSLEMRLQYSYCFALDPGTQNTDLLLYEGLPGTINDEALPTNVAAVVRLRQSEVPGRHNGKIYIPGLPEAASVDSVVDNTWYGANMVPFILQLKEALVAGGVNNVPVCVGRVFDGVPDVPRGFTILDAEISRSFATIRRRTTELRSLHP